MLQLLVNFIGLLADRGCVWGTKGQASGSPQTWPSSPQALTPLATSKCTVEQLQIQGLRYRASDTDRASPSHSPRPYTRKVQCIAMFCT